MGFQYSRSCRYCHTDFRAFRQGEYTCPDCKKAMEISRCGKTEPERLRKAEEKFFKQEKRNYEREEKFRAKLKNTEGNINEQTLSYKMQLELGQPDRRFVLMPFVIEDYEKAIMLNGKRVGAVDFIIRHYNSRYALEIKAANGSNPFWSATKILAYTIMLNQQEGGHYKPAVLLPIECISKSNIALARNLEIKFFSYEYDPHAERVFINTEGR